MLLTFEFKSVEEAQEFLKGLTSAQPRTAEAPAAIPRVEVSPSKSSEPAGSVVEGATPSAVEAALPAPSKKARAKKAEPAPAPAPEEPTTKYTLDNVRDALTQVFNTKGRAPVADILKNAGAHSVSDLTPDLFAAVIADAKKVLA